MVHYSTIGHGFNWTDFVFYKIEAFYYFFNLSPFCYLETLVFRSSNNVPNSLDENKLTIFIFQLPSHKPQCGCCSCAKLFSIRHPQVPTTIRTTIQWFDWRQQWNGTSLYERHSRWSSDAHCPFSCISRCCPNTNVFDLPIIQHHTSSQLHFVRRHSLRYQSSLRKSWHCWNATSAQSSTTLLEIWSVCKGSRTDNAIDCCRQIRT